MTHDSRPDHHHWNNQHNDEASSVRFRITGPVAHARLVPLLPSHWTDCSPYAASPNSESDQEAASSSHGRLDFLWENAMRRDTKHVRDHVRVYSHLPNGTFLLDSKWVLAKLLDTDRGSKDMLAVLKSHCFMGRSGLRSVCDRLGLQREPCQSASDADRNPARFRDLVDSHDVTEPLAPSNPRTSLWVIKDAMANGAGGVWIVGPQNVASFLDADTSPLVEQHSYVAQQYAWPPVLYRGRKCHVRVYACFTSDGWAFVHERCFLHVANEPFTANGTVKDESLGNVFEDSVHITNCCANSHDANKFAGEICASLKAEQWSWLDHLDDEGGHQPVVPLAKFAPSIHASVRALAERTFPFLQGGEVNNGFEYLGMDFILSFAQDGRKPLAYLLEVNAPPSQDTATGLAHAENLHDTVLRDLMTLWVVPKVTGAEPVAGGWDCVYRNSVPRNQEPRNGIDLTFSKATLINKVRWMLYERTLDRNSNSQVSENEGYQLSKWHSIENVTSRIRKLFPFFHACDTIFFESAGGSQVPQLVIDEVMASLANRHRTCVGARSKSAAAQTISSILGASPDKYAIRLGANATSLLHRLAQEYLRSGKLQATDEIIISTENHLANVNPWLEVAQTLGATVKWWNILPSKNKSEQTPTSLDELVTRRTRLVILSHASNILGEVRDLRPLKRIVDRLSSGRAELIVDGVAAVPHVYVGLDSTGVDWYVISCHKLFGPHLGAIIGRRDLVESLDLEHGTTNFEACAGIGGLGRYFMELATIAAMEFNQQIMDPECLSEETVRLAYRLITHVEAQLCSFMMEFFAKSSHIEMLGSVCELGTTSQRIPVFSFRHALVANAAIIASCLEGKIVARHGTFLSNNLFQEHFNLDEEGVVRLSLSHYSQPSEIRRLTKVLSAMPGW